MNRNRIPFAADKDSAQFERELTLLLIREFDGRRAKHVPQENLQIFYHGRKWQFNRQERDGKTVQTGELQRKSVTGSISFDRVIAHDVKLITEYISKLADGMEHQLLETMLEEMNVVCEESGNTISVAKTGSLADAFLELVRTTDVFIGPDGEVSLPTLYMPKESIAQLKKELAERGPDFDKQIKALQEQKAEEARSREAARLAHYEISE